MRGIQYWILAGKISLFCQLECFKRMSNIFSGIILVFFYNICSLNIVRSNDSPPSGPTVLAAKVDHLSLGLWPTLSREISIPTEGCGMILGWQSNFSFNYYLEEAFKNCEHRRYRYNFSRTWPTWWVLQWSLTNTHTITNTSTTTFVVALMYSCNAKCDSSFLFIWTVFSSLTT